MLQFTRAEVKFLVEVLKQTADGLLEAKSQTEKDKSSFGNDIDGFLDVMATYDQMLRHCESVSTKCKGVLNVER